MTNWILYSNWSFFFDTDASYLRCHKLVRNPQHFMRRKIKPFPIFIAFLILSLVVAYFAGIFPSIEDIKENRRSKPLYIEEDTDWTIVDSPYKIYGDLIIEEEASLTIHPGVEILLSENSHILVHGLLEAAGTTKEKITFKSLNSTYWEGFIFTNSCGKEDKIERRFGHITNANINNAKNGIRIESCPLDIKNCTILGSNRAIHISQNTNVNIENNVITDSRESLWIEQSKPLKTNDIPIVTNNEFSNGELIHLGSSVEFSNNQIFDFEGTYGAIYVAPKDSHLVKLMNNQFENLSRAIDIGSFKNARIEISNNCFKNNESNIYLECFNIEKTSLQILKNNFWNYKAYQIKALDGCGNNIALDLSENYWGTSDLEAIQKGIWNFDKTQTIDFKTYLFYPTSCKVALKEIDSKKASSHRFVSDKNESNKETLIQETHNIKQNKSKFSFVAGETIIEGFTEGMEINGVFIFSKEVKELIKTEKKGTPIELTVENGTVYYNGKNAKNLLEVRKKMN